MIAENYCYTRANLTIREMAARGLFGELYFGEGEYLHEVKSWQHAPGRGTNLEVLLAGRQAREHVPDP